MIVPVRCGNSGRADIKAIAASLSAARGDAITTAVGSTVWIETQAHARAIYGIWAANAKMRNQFDPTRMSDFIGRWETILFIAPLPTDTLGDRRNRIAAKFLQLGTYPNRQGTVDLLAAALPKVFRSLVNATASSSNCTFPGGVTINGGPAATDGPWMSTVATIAVETHQPQSMTDATFGSYVRQIYTLLASFFPSWTTFDWFNNQFTDNGTLGGLGLITGSVGSNALNSVSTMWNTAINATDGINSLMPGDELCYFDDNGTWQVNRVSTVVSDTQCTLIVPLPSNVTGRRYWMKGVYLDCDPTHAPYPNTGTHNLDYAGIWG